MRKVELAQVKLLFRSWMIIIGLAAILGAFAAVQAAQPSKGDRAPALDIRDLDGKRLVLSEELKKGPVFISFWATWCAPCREEFPLVSAMAKKFQKQGVIFVSVAVQDRPDPIKRFVTQQKPVQRVAHDADDKAFNAWDLRSVPANFLVGKNGRVAGFYDTFDKSDIPAIEAEIKRALHAYGR